MKNSFVIYYNSVENFQMLTDREAGKLIKAVIRYEIEGVLPDFKDRFLQMIFANLRSTLDFNRTKYNERCEKSKKAAEARWKNEKTDSLNANVCKGIRSDAKNADKDNDKEKENDKDYDNVYVYDKESEENVHFRQAEPESENAQKQPSAESTYTHKPSADKSIVENSFEKKEDSREVYGLFRNVRLTVAEYEYLKKSFPDADKRIEELSAYMSSNGKTYENHLAKLLQWTCYPSPEVRSKKQQPAESEASYDVQRYMQRAFDVEQLLSQDNKKVLPGDKPGKT